MTCPYVNADYCMDHDYDHVLAQREDGTIPSEGIVHATREQIAGMSVEASDLGMRAGRWADAIIVPDRRGFPVAFTRGAATIDENENEITSVAYVATLPTGPVTLTVWND